MGRPLVVNTCQGKCNWHPTDEEIDRQQVFECGACQSEWTAAQPWTPQDHDGTITPKVKAAREAAT